MTIRYSLLALTARMAIATVFVLALSSAAGAVPPVNDKFANAYPITSGQVITATNSDADFNEAGEPNPWGEETAQRSVWWKFTASFNGPVTVRTCGSSWVTLLAVYVANAVGPPRVDALLEMAHAYTGCPGETFVAMLTFNGIAGTTYYITVDSPAFNCCVQTIVLYVNQVPLACTPRAKLGDFHGDGRRDLLFRRPDGALSIFQMNGFDIQAAQVIGTVGTEWNLIGVGDFNGDGKSDLLFRRIVDGMLSVFLMDGFNVQAARLIGAVGYDWQFLGTGDFNADGKSDLAFFNRAAGAVSIYLMNGFNVLAAQIAFSIAPNYEIVGIGDFNGDGRSDFLTRHPTSGQINLLLMDGFTLAVNTVLGFIGKEWVPAGIGDLNGDGRADILFRRSDGMLSAYLINANAQVAQAQILGTIGTEWTLIGVGDYNGDAKADLLWRRNDGLFVLYEMNGFTTQAAQILGFVGNEWTMCHVTPG